VVLITGAAAESMRLPNDKRRDGTMPSSTSVFFSSGEAPRGHQASVEIYAFSTKTALDLFVHQAYVDSSYVNGSSVSTTCEHHLSLNFSIFSDLVRIQDLFALFCPPSTLHVVVSCHIVQESGAMLHCRQEEEDDGIERSRNLVVEDTRRGREEGGVPST
jgi:hypothetical protein